MTAFRPLHTAHFRLATRRGRNRSLHTVETNCTYAVMLARVAELLADPKITLILMDEIRQPGVNSRHWSIARGVQSED